MRRRMLCFASRVRQPVSLERLQPRGAKNALRALWAHRRVRKADPAAPRVALRVTRATMLKRRAAQCALSALLAATHPVRASPCAQHVILVSSAPVVTYRAHRARRAQKVVTARTLAPRQRWPSNNARRARTMTKKAKARPSRARHARSVRQIPYQTALN